MDIPLFLCDAAITLAVCVIVTGLNLTSSVKSVVEQESPSGSSTLLPAAYNQNQVSQGCRQPSTWHLTRL